MTPNKIAKKSSMISNKDLEVIEEEEKSLELDDN